MKIGNVELKSNLMFAPIAGYSEVAFRYLCQRYGAALTFTELISSKGLCYNNKNTKDLLQKLDDESPCAVQLFGSDPDFMYKAAKDARLSKFDIIDINMGCPVKKVFNNGDGSALMKDVKLIEEVVKAVKEGSNRPVSVKMRAGVEMSKPLAVECAIAAQKGGADMVTIHPRYREQYYGGQADHTITRDVKKELSIPVVANGDIVDKESFERIRDLTNADGFMIARGALGRPYIFSELLGEEVEVNLRDLVLEHVEILRKFYPDQTVCNMMKTQLCYYAKGKDFAKQVRKNAVECKTIDDTYRIVEEYFV